MPDRRALWALGAALALSAAGAAAEDRPRARTVVDLSGTAVTLPGRVARVACLEVLCYPRMLTLGAARDVVQMTETDAPWMEVVDPRVREIPKVPAVANLEDLVARKVDAVFFFYDLAQTRARLGRMDVPALVSQPPGTAASAAEFVAANRRAVRLFGEVLGGAAARRAEDWCAWYDERVHYVTSRTARLTRAQRPRVYYVRGPDGLTTQGQGSATFWYGEMAGGDMVVKDVPLAGRGPVSMESVLRWDPQFLLVGRSFPAALVLSDPRWQSVSAVVHRQVIESPVGVFYWDGGPESALLLEFLAKTLHPELFPELDLGKEVADYYLRFYGYRLSREQVRLLLAGRGPDGAREAR